MAVSILDRHLEGLEVDLADSLLVGPGSHHAVTVAFLIVQGKVLHVSVDAVLLCACDGVCGHSTGQDTVLRVVLEVTAGECGAVDVHGRAIPAGSVHLIGHLADAVAEVVGQILAPGHTDEGSRRETDRTDAGEVVVDGCRAVTVVGAHLADAVHGCGLVAAEADGLLQVVDAHLIQQVIPLGIIVVHAAQVSQLEAVLCAGGDVLCVGIFVLFVAGLGVGEAVLEASLDLVAHLIGSGSGNGLVVVCKAVCTGQIGDLALGEIELVGRHDLVALALVGLVVNDVGSDGVGLGIQNIVGVRVGADDVIASLQHIAAVVLVIVGSQILDRDGEVDGLALAGGKLAGLGEVQQVCGSLLNAAVGIRRIIIDLHDILAGSRAGIGDGNREL